MSFSAEIKDFIAGFRAGASVGGDIQQNKLAREKFAFEQEKYGAANARADRSLALREKAYADRQNTRVAKGKAGKPGEAAVSEKKRAERARGLLGEEASGKSSKPQYEDEYYDEPEDEASGDEGYEEEADGTYDESSLGAGFDVADAPEESAIPVPEVTGEEVAFSAKGGVVGKKANKTAVSQVAPTFTAPTLTASSIVPGIQAKGNKGKGKGKGDKNNKNNKNNNQGTKLDRVQQRLQKAQERLAAQRLKQQERNKKLKDRRAARKLKRKNKNNNGEIETVANTGVNEAIKVYDNANQSYAGAGVEGYDDFGSNGYIYGDADFGKLNGGLGTQAGANTAFGNNAGGNASANAFGTGLGNTAGFGTDFGTNTGFGTDFGSNAGFGTDFGNTSSASSAGFGTGFSDAAGFGTDFGNTNSTNTSALGNNLGTFARGGMVLHAEDGTLVPEDGDEEPESAIPTEALIPRAEAAATANREGKSEPEVNREGKSDPVFKEAANVIRDVMDTMNDELSKSAEEPESAIPTSSKKIQDRLADVEPASQEEIDAIDDTIGEMDEFRKGAARYVDAYKFYVSKGDITKARKIAAQILKYNELASMTLGELAMDAIEDGDIMAASKLVADAYNENVPDGGKMDATVRPNGTIAYKIDQQGYASQIGEVGAQQLWTIAAKVADGSAFLDRMTKLAAMGEPAAATAGGTKKGKGKKRSYTADVEAAGQAAAELEAMQVSIEEAGDAAPAELIKEFNTKREAFDAALKQAKKARLLTKRSMEQFKKDFEAAKKTAVPRAIPETAEEEPEDDRGILQRAQDWLDSQDDGRSAGRILWDGITGQSKPTGQAIPESPASAAPANTGKPLPPEDLAKAKAAIAEGRSREGVLKKIRDAGFSTEGL